MQEAQYVESMKYFIPFVTVVWHNSKGRVAFSVMNTDVVREPIASDWCTTDMSVENILEKLRHDGGQKTMCFSERNRAIHLCERNKDPGCHTISGTIY